MRIYDLRMKDGSREFGALPETYDVRAPEWHRLRTHVAALAGAVLTGFHTDDVTEAWIEWTWRGHAWSMNNQQNEWFFFVADPSCPEPLLVETLAHFEGLLQPMTAFARAAGVVAVGYTRVLVVEPDARVHHRDFADLEEAMAYAADVRAEVEDDRGSPIAVLFDDQLTRR